MCSHIVVKSRQFRMTVPFFYVIDFYNLIQCNCRLFYTLFYVKWWKSQSCRWWPCFHSPVYRAHQWMLSRVVLDSDFSGWPDSPDSDLLRQSRRFNSESTQHVTFLDWLNSDSIQIQNFLTWLTTHYILPNFWPKAIDWGRGAVECSCRLVLPLWRYR